MCTKTETETERGRGREREKRKRKVMPSQGIKNGYVYAEWAAFGKSGY